MLSLLEISRFLLGPLGVILVNFGGLLGVCWGYFGHPLERLGSLWVPLGLLWSLFGTLGSLCGPFGPLMVSFWNPCTPCGLLLDSFRSVLGCFG